MHSLGDISSNDLYDLPVNGLDVLTIKVRPRDVCGLHKLSATVLKRLSINISPCDVIESVDIIYERGLPGMYGFGKKFLNGMNVLNELGMESAQEHTLSWYEF